MRRQSHLTLGHYLSRHYLSGIPEGKQQAFFLGCVEPDLNPFTYFKGSSGCNFLRGHHFPNSAGYMQRLSRRLHRKKRLGILDYYSLGKLVHYTADAFTHAHNQSFCGGLSAHRIYEQQLQDHFLNQLNQVDPSPLPFCGSLPDPIHILHRQYIRRDPGIETDSFYIHRACCTVLSILHP